MRSRHRISYTNYTTECGKLLASAEIEFHENAFVEPSKYSKYQSGVGVTQPISSFSLFHGFNHRQTASNLLNINFIFADSVTPEND